MADNLQACSFDRIKYAFGEYLQRYHQFLAPTTDGAVEWMQRPFSKSVFIAQGRMIDDTEKLLSEYRKTGNPSLPVILVCFDKEPLDIQGNFSRQVADEQWVQLPSDDKERFFKMRQIQQQRRVQMAFIAADEPTAHCIAVQFARTFVEVTGNDRMKARYDLLGQSLEFPIMIMRDDVELSNAAPEEKNLTILLLDLQLRETIPVFKFPDYDEPEADGKGSNNTDDPSGYSGVRNVIVQEVGIDGITRINIEGVTRHDLHAGSDSELCG